MAGSNTAAVIAAVKSVFLFTMIPINIQVHIDLRLNKAIPTAVHKSMHYVLVILIIFREKTGAQYASSQYTPPQGIGLFCRERLFLMLYMYKKQPLQVHMYQQKELATITLLFHNRNN